MRELILRDYQQRLVDDIRGAWTRDRRVLAYMPTGAGKTEVSVYLAQREADIGGCTLFVVDRRTLAAQARNRYGAEYGMLTGLIRGEDTFVRGYEPVLVGTVQTLAARWDHPEIRAALARVTLIVMDEAHIRFQHHQAIVDHLPHARVLGLSATPLRDGLGLMFNELVRGPGYADLIERGYLVPGRYFLPAIEDVERGLRDVATASTGDYVNSQLSELMRRRTIVGDVIETWRERGENRRTICFAVDIAHSKALCDGFLRAGVPAEHIDLHTTEDDRTAMFRRFRRGDTRVLCSVAVLAVGFDEPMASCAILARPTLSLTMHIQQIGRVLRAAEGKADALILDHAANVLRHGKVEDFIPPDLSEIDKQTDRAARNHVSDQFPCPDCRAVMNPGQRVCQECGHEMARDNSVDHVHGRLIEAPEDHQAITGDELQNLYCELRAIHRGRGKDADAASKQAWAQIRSHFDFSCPRAWRFLPEKTPTAATVNLDLSWRIAYRKRMEKERKKAPVQPCACGSTATVRGPGSGPHAARLSCAECGRFRQWIPKSQGAVA